MLVGFYEAWMIYEYKDKTENLKKTALEQRSRLVFDYVTAAGFILL